MFFMGFEYKIPVFDAHILCAVEVIMQLVIAAAMAILFDCQFGEVTHGDVEFIRLHELPF